MYAPPPSLILVRLWEDLSMQIHCIEAVHNLSMSGIHFSYVSMDKLYRSAIKHYYKEEYILLINGVPVKNKQVIRNKKNIKYILSILFLNIYSSRLNLFVFCALFKGLFTNFSNLYSRFGWVSRSLTYRSNLKWRSM